MNYLEYLNENYFREKGFTKLPSKLNKMKAPKRMHCLYLIKKFLYLSRWT